MAYALAMGLHGSMDCHTEVRRRIVMEMEEATRNGDVHIGAIHIGAIHIGADHTWCCSYRGYSCWDCSCSYRGYSYMGWSYKGYS